MPGAVLGGGSLLPEPELEELDELEELELPYVVICTSPLSYVLPSLPLVTVFGTLSKFRGWPYTTSPL